MLDHWSKTYPVTESLRFSEDGLCYEWNDAAIYVDDETARYAFHSGAGCSCNSLEDDYHEDFFKYELVWTPNPEVVFEEMADWIDGLENAGERAEKRGRLRSWYARETMG